MTDKLITDYPLRSAVTPEVNFFVDDGTQSYRVTAEQLLTFINPIPVGSGVDYWGEILPPLYVWADGSLLNPANYPELFAVYGTKFGGDGINTFGVPDKRDRASVGKGNMGGVPANRVTNAVSGFDTTVLGASGGAQSHTLTSTEMPSHTHTQNAHQHLMFNSSSPVTSISEQGAPNVSAAEYVAGSTYSSGGIYSTYRMWKSTSNAAANVGLTSLATAANQNTGGGGAHRNMQPSITCNYIIKCK